MQENGLPTIIAGMSIAPGPYVPHLFGDKVVAMLKRPGRWLSAAVNHSIAWPRRDMMLKYNGIEFFLRGIKQGDRTAGACISVFMGESDLHDALAAVYKFASMLGWYKQGFVEITGHISGGHATRYEGPRAPFGPAITAGDATFNCNYMPIVVDATAARALAFWREGKWLEHLHDGYAFLSFYKVIESQFTDGRKRGSWIDQALPTLPSDAVTRLRELTNQGVKNLGMHIFESGRCAVAHATVGEKIVDPDVPADLIRLSKDLVVIRDLAEKYIREVLQVPDSNDVYHRHDRLAPLYPLMSQENVEALQRGGTLPRRSIEMHGMRIAVNVWPNEPPEKLRELRLTVSRIRDGRVSTVATNEAGTIQIPFGFDFPHRRAHAMEGFRYATKAQGGNLKDAIAVNEYRKAVLCNHIVEITLPSDDKVSCEVVIPINVDIAATLETWDQEIERMRGQTE